jgi:hypothetical protein
MSSVLILLRQPEQSLVFITGDTTGNILHCTIKRTIVSTSSQIFDLSKDWYLLFARGNVSSGEEYRFFFK